MLSIKGLSFGYQKQRPQLSQINLTIEQGDILGLLGPNGAGKTTLVSLIAGLLHPHEGTITYAGELARAGRRDLALVPQEYAFYPRLSGRENLNYFAGIAGLSGRKRSERVAEIITECGLDALADQRAERYSGGFKRRLNFAIALLQQPRLLILDEPTANVDPQSRAFLLEIVRRLNRDGVTIIYTSHLLEEVESLCRSVAVMDGGKIVLRGSMNELLAAQQNSLIIQVARPLPAVVAAWPGVQQGSKNKDEWLFDLHQLQASAAAILTRLEQAGVTPVRIQLGQRRLEEVFLASTERELRK